MGASAGRFDGRTALVTGASRGIGLAIAHRLVDEGARVCITARKAEGLDSALAEFASGTAIAIAGKADDPVHRKEALDLVASRFGRLDVLVNNAGINPVYGPLVELDLEAARKIIEVNLIANLAWVQSVWHDTRLGFAERGSVVSLSSVTGQNPSPGIGWYGVGKAAIAHLTRTLAVELGPNVRVNAVAPAVVKTQFAKLLYEDREHQILGDYPLGRLGDPEDIASAVAFLASDDASWITGQVLNLDGGLLVSGGTVR